MSIRSELQLVILILRPNIYLPTLVAGNEVVPELDRATLAVGDLLDGYCVRTFKWYPAKIIAVSGAEALAPSCTLC